MKVNLLHLRLKKPTQTHLKLDDLLFGICLSINVGITRVLFEKHLFTLSFMLSGKSDVGIETDLSAQLGTKKRNKVCQGYVSVFKY